MLPLSARYCSLNRSGPKIGYPLDPIEARSRVEKASDTIAQRLRIIGRTADVLNLGGQKHAVGVYETIGTDVLGVAGTCTFVRQTKNAEDFIGIVAETNEGISEARAHELTALLPKTPWQNPNPC